MQYLLIALLIGAIIPIQTAANSRLRMAVGNRPIVSALISFSIALAVSILITAVVRGNPVPQFAVAPPWWAWLGGCFGCLFIIGNILLFQKLGPVQTVVLTILGQVTMGLAIDQFGLFRAKQVDVTAMRLVGALVVLLGIAVVLGIGMPQTQGSKVSGAEEWLFRGLGVAVGMGSAMQTAINGYLGTIAGSSYHAAEINLAVGMVLLMIAALATSPRQLTRRPEPGPWWMWLGGVIGAIFVAGGATLAPIIGTATTVIAFNAGTIAGGQLMESVGAFGAPKRRMDTRRLTGLALILAGVIAVRLL
ncbi:DMT family transporter [Corynebacterium sp. TA-R-1]|uniref:DMT family transporter n=1 Tax=Corynebacterium stercoris TaxID=2943490 RepID=A0ABT1FYJ6_9CORY|nr:DMT family transporter [Corynebacterium stercoris]MCP1386809.1 DMT family transporter [Corynebacterium stercoris]